MSLIYIFLKKTKIRFGSHLWSLKTIFIKAQGKHTCFEDKMSINEGDAELEKKSSHLTLKSYSCVKEKFL